MNGLRPSAVRRWDFVINRLPWWRRLTAPQLFVGSFGLMILLGTVGLKVLPGLYLAKPLSWEEALFTTTSAVCVTGLNVIDPGTRFTPMGHAYVLVLIQLGGLGMITFTSLIILAMGGRLSLRQESLANAAAESSTTVNPRALIYAILKFTFGIEALGALALYVQWIPRFGWIDAAGHAVYHAVSAFCNAGFSTFTANLMEFQRSPGILIVIAGLIIAGGLGFLTMQELDPLSQRSSRRRYHLSIQSRLVLFTTVFLIVAGWLAFAVVEWNETLRHLPWFDRLVNAFFLSVTARTAGYNSIDYGQAQDSSNFLTILLMMIGGSPGSTAGGIKTTTFALLGILAWTRLAGDDAVSVFGRSIRKDNVDRAIGLFVISFGIVTLGILLLSITERGGNSGRFLDHMFEVVSGFNTVGLSTGITPRLSSAGRMIIISMMFLGRVGPLSVAASLARPVRAGTQFRYAYEDVMVG